MTGTGVVTRFEVFGTCSRNGAVPTTVGEAFLFWERFAAACVVYLASGFNLVGEIRNALFAA